MPLTPTHESVDARGYRYVETSEEWMEACRTLPCFPQLWWPDYATKVIEEPAKSSEESEKPTRAAPLSAVAQEPDPDATPTPDGKTSEAVSADEKTVESKPTAVGKTSGKEKPPGPPAEAEKGETEKERADTGTES